MRNKVKTALLYSIIFIIGLFLGEWLIDSILKINRDSFIKELVQSVIIGTFVGILFAFSKNKKQ
ncbi:MAG: hypothetical protein GX102_02070 [Porphyromonadaceae bacterium]|jgi:hypothetical protein|nr:hypothetical protein [Porphyromonadaceae bacterium]